LWLFWCRITFVVRFKSSESGEVVRSALVVGLRDIPLLCQCCDSAVVSFKTSIIALRNRQLRLFVISTRNDNNEGAWQARGFCMHE